MPKIDKDIRALMKRFVAADNHVVRVDEFSDALKIMVAADWVDHLNMAGDCELTTSGLLASEDVLHPWKAWWRDKAITVLTAVAAAISAVAAIIAAIFAALAFLAQS